MVIAARSANCRIFVAMKKLYFGDNLYILREHIASESVNGTVA